LGIHIIQPIGRIHLEHAFMSSRLVFKLASDWSEKESLARLLVSTRQESAIVSLETLLAKGPAVVSFYRGEWCPFCNLELRALQEVLPEMEKLGASLIAISPERPDHGVIATDKNKLTFPVLSDFGNKVARQFGIVFQMGQEVQELARSFFNNDIAVRNADGLYELPVPATYVIDKAGFIRFAHVEVDFMTGRAEPEAVLAALHALE
jgi:peroxiredoxin